MPGKVFLVGAGPGDWRLTTLKTADALKLADVVIYDRLADQRILSFAPRTAEFIYVGKASSHHTMKQDDISRLICDKALEGKTVVRLKGGDPFVFGRGGEEALLLKENHIPFEIVPGVTSAISVPAYAGIPVTHRAIATSFAVVTGHEDPAKGESNMRWDKLATATDTIVFLMGVENLPKICARLMESGRDGNTPAAVIRWGTKACQETLITTVAAAAADVKAAGLKPPAIFIVGEVVNLRKEIAWFDNPVYRPLFGKTVLVTRARAQASALTARLEELGANVVEMPAIELAEPDDKYAALDGAIGELETYDWLIFTSANGVDRFFRRLRACGKDARKLARAKLCAIGSATADRLAEYGLLADTVPKEYRAEGIIESLRDLKPGTKILIPRAQAAREILPEKLREMGCQVTVAPAYKTVTAAGDPQPVIAALKEGKIDIVTFTSTSTVDNLVKILGDARLLATARVAVIGPVTGEACARNGIKITAMAEKYTIPCLVETIKKLAE